MEIKSVEIAITMIIIITCPSSKPRLKYRSGKVTFSELPNMFFSRYEKPKPCIKPNNNTTL